MSLNLVVGPMWAGKSSYILSKIRRYKAIGWGVYVITSALDNRYGDFVISNHDSDQFPAIAVRKLAPLRETSHYKEAKLIILEEAQFFEDLVPFVLQAVEEDAKHVICVGLDGDSERRPFGDILLGHGRERRERHRRDCGARAAGGRKRGRLRSRPF